jgi:hypothetical protein
MSLSAIINAALLDASTQMTTQVLHQAIARLADKYGFDAAEAIQFVNLAPARPELLKKSDLPWCGVADPTWCKALSFSGGLYRQCHKAPVDGSLLCGACSRQATETGSLKNGDVDARLAATPFGFLDGKVAPFTKLMAKNGWSKELVEQSAAAYGLTIPPENFQEIKPKRGRKVSRPVMNTPEPLAITATLSQAEDSVVPPVVVASQEEEVAAPATPSRVIMYNATDPDSDDELQEEAPVAESKTKKGGAKAGSPKPKAEKVKAEPKPKVEKPKAEPKPKAEKPKAEKPKAQKPKAEPKPQDEKPEAESNSESEGSKSDDDAAPEVIAASSGGAEVKPESPKQEKVKKPAADYTNITAEEVATMKALNLRTACAQHGIEIGSKSVDTLRAELIQKVSA